MSNEEIDADKSLSGGNLSASNGAIHSAASVNAAISPDEVVMKKIYHSNHSTTANYKLESAVVGDIEVLE